MQKKFILVVLFGLALSFGSTAMPPTEDQQFIEAFGKARDAATVLNSFKAKLNVASYDAFSSVVSNIMSDKETYSLTSDEVKSFKDAWKKFLASNSVVVSFKDHKQKAAKYFGNCYNSCDLAYDQCIRRLFADNCDVKWLGCYSGCAAQPTGGITAN